MKKALVTGADGFIGSHVVKILLERGVAVRAMIRPGEPTLNLEGLEVEQITGDLLDPAFVKQSVQHVDTVFHLAAIYAIWMPDWKPLYEINLQGSRNMLWACLKAGVKRVVYTSSIAAIGVNPGETPATEETVFNQYNANPYILSKYFSQQEALGFAQNGLDLVVVNPAFPFGPGDRGPTPTGQIIVDLLNGKAPISVHGGFSAVDVRDVALGHVLAAEKGKAGEKYILSNQNLNLDQFRQLTEEAAGVKLKKIPGHVPVPILWGAAHVLTWVANKVTHKPPLTTPKEVEFVSKYLYFDHHKAAQELGLQFRDVSISLRDAIAWFRSHGYIK